MSIFRIFLLSLLLSNISTFQISHLKDNYVNFFKKPINYQYYSDDIQFHSNLFPSIKGKEPYQFTFNSLQFLSKILFLHYQIDIHSSKETNNNIELFWKFKGLTKMIYPISIEGLSTYQKDPSGHLSQHNITFHIKSFPNMIYYNSSTPSSLDSPCLFHPHHCFLSPSKTYPHPWLHKPIKILK